MSTGPNKDNAGSKVREARLAALLRENLKRRKAGDAVRDGTAAAHASEAASLDTGADTEKP